MINSILKSSRRNFFEQLAIASTLLAVSPTTLMGQRAKKLLHIAILGKDSLLSAVVDKSDKMMIINDYKLADIIYVKDCDTINLQKALMAQKHLIIERNEVGDSMIKKCQESGVLLAIVERAETGMKLFSSADYFESNLNQSSDFQNVIEKLNFLVINTQNDKFKIFSL